MYCAINIPEGALIIIHRFDNVKFSEFFPVEWIECPSFVMVDIANDTDKGLFTLIKLVLT